MTNLEMGIVSVRPAPKGGCGHSPSLRTFVRESVSVRPAPKGGCGCRRMEVHSDSTASQ